MLDPGSSRLGEAACALQGLRVVAKRELIKSQLLREKILLTGLQETRLRDTATLPDSHFIMLHSSADDKGHYGVGLWANTTEAYAHSNDQQWFLQRGHFTVLVCQPRLLVVQICAPFLRLTIVVAHAPSEVRGNEGTAAAFWRECRAALSRRVKDSEVVVLTDANARIGSLTSEAVGPCWAETETGAGQAFHQFVAEEILKVPATFHECQEGPGYTWTSPVGLKHRIDYVCVPSTWPLSGIRTFVWGDFESMQLRDDHFPSVLHADFASHTGSGTSARYLRLAARPVGVVASDDYLCSLQAVSTSPPLAWSAGVDAHYSHLAREWVQLGKGIGEPTVRQPRQLYLSATTLRLVAWRKAWRQQLRTWSLQTRCRTLAYCWIAWRAFCQGTAPSPPEALRLSLWVSQMLPDIAQAAMLVFRMGRQLKRLARQDRLDYLDGLAANVSLADVKDSKTLYRRVRQAFPASRSGRRPTFCPLPAVLDKEGQLVNGADARQERWREHFAEQEGGCSIADDGFVPELRRQRASVSRVPSFDISCIPTLADIEQTILALPLGKASGYDGVTAELLRLHGPASARLLLPVYVKSTLSIYEPVEFRGGALLPLAKRAAAAFSVDKFRSILISSLPGKILHRQYRTALLPALRSVKGDLQAGALPGVSTEAITMTARAFRDVMSHRNRAWSLAFFDVRAAYYRVLRQLLARVGDHEHAFRRLMHELGVPTSALSELALKLDQVGALADAGVPEHMQHLLVDAMQGTWFRIDCGAAMTITSRGVRPGDCLADVLFSFTFSAYLTATEGALHRAGLGTSMPLAEAPSPWLEHPAPEDLSCASWADDFVHLFSQQCKHTLSRNVVRTVSLFVEQADTIGMALTFAVDKTAAILSHVTQQQEPVRQDSEGSFLLVTSAVTGSCHRLPVVDAYKHLGGIATTTGTPEPEICYRHSLAMSVIRPLRTRLFSAIGIPMTTRSTLLRTLAVSRFAFGSAALPLHTAIHRRLWAKHYVALWRALWRRRKGDPCRHSFAVLGAVGAPTPPLALAMSRAVLLRQLIRAGPASLLQLLFVQWIECPKKAWISLVLEDVKHVLQYQDSVRVVLQAPDPFGALLSRLRESPGWWISQVRAATRLAVQDMNRWCSGVSLRPLAAAVVGTCPGPAEGFQCSWCGASFPLRKHLGAHMAKSHRIFSPARHLAHGSTCPSCMVCYWSVGRLQQHLKRSDHCIRRVCHLVPCLSITEVREAEGQDSRAAKRLRQGVWQQFSATLPAVQAEGPRALTADEYVAEFGESIDLSHLGRLFRPEPSTVEWIESFVSERSSEGPRGTAAAFWACRPALHPFHQNS